MTHADALAEGIVDAVGGAGNIRSLGHCTTRLRLVLADKKLADSDAVRALPGIMSTVDGGGQFQVVIGHQVRDVEDRVRSLVAAQGRVPDEAPQPLSPVDRAFDFFMGTFQPLLWALVGASMVRTALSLAERFDWIDTSSGTYAVWAAAGGAVFLLLPVFVGITAATKLGANPYVGGAIGAALVAGALVELGEPGMSTTFLGLPLRLVDYTSSVFPAMLAALGLSVLERWLRRIVPRDLHLVAVPTICLAVLVPATVLLFGPIGTTVGEAIGSAVTSLNEFSPLLTGALYAAGFMFLVMLGLHWATLPAVLVGLAADGMDPLPAYMGAANFAVFGVALGVALRTREQSLRQLGTSGLITGVLAGISEPTVYGILLRFKRTLVIMLASAAAGGALLGLGRVESTAFVFSNVFTIPAMDPIGSYLLGIGVSFMLAATLVVVLGYEGRPAAELAAGGGEERTGADARGGGAAGASEVLGGPGAPGRPTSPGGPVAAGGPVAGPVTRGELVDPGGPEAPSGESPSRGPAEVPQAATILAAPMPGEVLPLSDVADPVFARSLMGPGVAIRPTGGLVRSPAAGAISSVARAQHALTVTTDSGVDVTIHIGIDTVHLAGRHFDVLVDAGQRVSSGQPIAHVDLAGLEADGYDPTTPVVVTNAAAFGGVTPLTAGRVGERDPLLEVARAKERE